MKPTVFFPAFRRSSLILLIREAKIGVLALVPPLVMNCLSKNIATLSPLAATSRYLLEISK